MASIGGLLDEVRGGEIGVALGEVDRAVEHREARHLADDGLGEDGRAVGDMGACWRGHAASLCCIGGERRQDGHLEGGGGAQVAHFRDE